jgi:hypothetical protein
VLCNYLHQLLLHHGRGTYPVKANVSYNRPSSAASGCVVWSLDTCRSSRYAWVESVHGSHRHVVEAYALVRRQGDRIGRAQCRTGLLEGCRLA